MLLSLDKSGVLHCGNYNQILQYITDGYPLPVMSHFKDLGVLRSERATYGDHTNIVAAQISKLCGTIWHFFRTRQPALLWTAYLSHVKQKLIT